MKIKYLVFVFALFLLACKAESQEVETEKEDLQLIKREKRDLYLDITNGNVVLDKVINGGEYELLEYITPPLEIALLTKKSIKKNDIKNLSKITNNYTTNYQKALALGVYSVNLAYINLYQLKDTAYLKEVKKLAKDLKIEHHIHFDSIAKFVYEDNFDNLLNETQRGYERVLHSGETVEQKYESFLIQVGLFVEMNYRTLSLYKKLQENKTDTTILNQWKERIGEQKLSIEHFLLAFEMFKPYDKSKYILNDLKALKNSYENVEIIAKQCEPNLVIKNGELIVQDRVELIITISDTTISKISEKTKEIRSKIVR